MNTVLSTTKEVVEKSTFVKINQGKLLEFANNFSHGQAKHWLMAAPIDFTKFSDEEKLHFIFLFNSLSFCYWGEPKWTIERDDKQFDGSWAMIKALADGIKDGQPLLDFTYCANINREDFAKILQGNVEIPLFEERWNILHELGQGMMEKFNGRAVNLVLAAQGDALKLLDLILENFSSFRDTSVYNNEEVYFYKRAQLLVADIFQLFDSKGFGALKNIDQFTACADYKLPQILRKSGILVYEKFLADKIDNKVELDHDSKEEVEIRANTIWAVELLRQEIFKFQPDIKAFEINDHLWLATQEKFPDDKPYHRARTMAY